MFKKSSEEMEQLKNLVTWLETVRSLEAHSFNCNEEAIKNQHISEQKEQNSLAIKILSLFGGLLAAMAFIGFLIILKVYEAEEGVLALGFGLVVLAVILARLFHKLFIDTFAVALYILGIVLFVLGLIALNFEDSATVLSVIVVSFLTLILSKNYILIFISVINIGVSILVLIALHNVYDAIHLYIILYSSIMTCFFLLEAKLLTSFRPWVKFYDPIRIGLIFCFLIGLIAIGKKDLVPLSQNFLWVSSILIISLVMVMVSQIIKTLGIERLNQKVLIYILSTIVLLPTLYAPSISGALLLILLTYKVNYKTGFAIGAIALIYFVIQYYYDLNLSLLIKSIILFASGIAFLLLYLYISKFLKHDKKV